MVNNTPFMNSAIIGMDSVMGMQTGPAGTNGGLIWKRWTEHIQNPQKDKKGNLYE